MKVVGNVFHDFYRQLVQALYDVGASPYVFCVNVDAVIAALLLALLWKDYKSGALGGRDLETAAFTRFPDWPSSPEERKTPLDIGALFFRPSPNARSKSEYPSR